MKKSLMVMVALLLSSAAFATTAKLDLKVEGNTLMAYVLVNGDTAGEVVVEWTAPADGYCVDSIKTLAYKPTGAWHTRASRTLLNPVKGTDCVATCSGVWTVKVTEGDVTLATGTITIGPDGKAVVAAPAKGGRR